MHPAATALPLEEEYPVTSSDISDEPLKAKAATSLGGRKTTPGSLLVARRLRDVPPPFPFGWFAVAFSRELRAGQILTRRFMDREVVIFRTKSGIARAIEAYCPHLGAHFGYGGKVEGEELRCPFHGLGFSINGACVYSPYGAPPPAARLEVLELREICGAIMLWHGPGDQVPWEIEEPQGDFSWRPLQYGTVRSLSHPQETVENLVDFAHFGFVHGVQEVKLVQPVAFDGPKMRVNLTFVQPVPFGRGIQFDVNVRCEGIGFVLSESKIGGWTTRQLVLSTPVAEREVITYVGSAVPELGRSALGKVMRNTAGAIVARLVLHQSLRGIRQDRLIWDHKKYLERPAIAAGDGPIADYRAWAKQFYPAPANV